MAPTMSNNIHVLFLWGLPQIILQVIICYNAGSRRDTMRVTVRVSTRVAIGFPDSVCFLATVCILFQYKPRGLSKTKVYQTVYFSFVVSGCCGSGVRVLDLGYYCRAQVAPLRPFGCGAFLPNVEEQEKGTQRGNGVERSWGFLSGRNTQVA